MGEEEIAIGGRGLLLASGWQFLPTEAGLAAELSGLPEKGWLPAQVPGTLASNLREAGAWTFDSVRDLDAEDCWFRCAFARPDDAAGAEARLVFDGLATLSEVFLNGAPVLATDNMFVRHSVDVTERLRDRNELAVACRSLGAAMKAKKGRPRYRTRLVEQQQLRFFRTTLLGRMPGWTPPCPPVGPFRAVRLELEKRAWLLSPRLRCRLEGDSGVVELSATMRLVGNARVERATLHAFGREHALRTTIRGDGFVALDGQARLPSVPLWWPHTHGDQPLYEVGLVVRFGDGETAFHPLGRVGFRKLELDTTAGGFRLKINGADVFCRGACWSPLDVVTFAATRAELRAAIEHARSAGMNMLRIPGTMAYEDDAFHEACDELGVLVWQDFMYANMDYPALDGAFTESAASEARSVVRRIGHRPSTAVFCGNSEVEQQAAMLGLPRDVWTNALFERVLPEIVGTDAPGVPYWPSSPSGGALPFAINEGVSHYYGVGAYERPLDDARRSGVRFASECLAFANVPEDRLLEQLSAEGIPPVHHPAWKRRVPRDRGASWDFDDVRDHYMERLFRRSPSDIRYSDPERYRQLARVTTGEVMHRAFSEWRRPGSTCHGALVWLLRDLWPGAGWGVIDADGTPKAAYFHLKRTLRPFCVLVSDEGLDGLSIHALNEGPSDVDVEVVLTLFRSGDVLVARNALNSRLPARSAITIPARQLLDTFVDVTFAYRFGPPSHDLVVVTLGDRAGVLAPSSAFYFPLGLPEAREPDVGLDATATPTAGGAFDVVVSARRFAQSVALDVEDAAIDDNYFHLEPGGQRTLRVEPKTPRSKLTGTVRALNAHAGTRIKSTE